MKEYGRLTSGYRHSFWVSNIRHKKFDAVTKNLDVDVLIVGAGIAGLSSAYFLSKHGKKVAVIEDGYLGSGETGRTTAHLTYELDSRYSKIKKQYGEKNAKKVLESHKTAIDIIEKIIKEEKINCDFERVDAYLCLNLISKKEDLIEEYQTLQSLGETETKFLKKGIFNLSCIKFPSQAQFHPIKYLYGLAEVITRNGGKIFTDSHATNIDSTGATVSGHKINAKEIIIATNTPIHTTVKMHTKQAPYRTYVIASIIPKNKFPKALFWDTGQDRDSPNSYFYVRAHPLDKNKDLIMIGNSDHKTGQAADFEQRFKILEAWARKNFYIDKIDYKWSGQVFEPIDSLAFIGKSPREKNIYIATGASGNGMTYGTIAGIILSDLISRNKNPWEKLYKPSRKKVKAARQFISENVNVVKQYFKKTDQINLKNIKVGQGAVIKFKDKNLAVYRDEKQLQKFSAVCPHLGCILSWNPVEKSFDCPCHGSRFTCYGRVICGPANSDLKKIKIE